MDKLARYNQKLLAIIGTLALVVVGLSVLGSAGALAIGLFQSLSNDNVVDNALTIEGSINDPDPQVKPVRNQEISLGKLQLIDTLNSIYLIPVSQVNLKNQESIDEPRGFFNTSSSYTSKMFKYGYRYSGVYNNLIIYDQQNERKTTVFEERIHVGAFRHFMIKNEQYLLIEGVNIDTNKDNKLTNSDLKSFFTFKISTEELREFSFQDMGLMDYYITFDSKEVILRFAQDKDKNGEIDLRQEFNRQLC